MRKKLVKKFIRLPLTGIATALTLLAGVHAHAQQGFQGPGNGSGSVGNLGGGGVQIDACTGFYFDPGGATGDYGNSENVTVTICPSGGPGSGPNTSVRFLQWSIAGAGDQLAIYQGTAVAGLPIATGTNITSLAAQTFTSSDASGCLTFHWQSDVAGTAAGWLARITTAPHPGSNTAVNVCAAAAPLSLFSLLGGDPDAGGSWQAPGGAPHSDTFDPAVDPAGSWTYSQSGPAPCPVASATLTITKIAAPDPGQDAPLTLCANQAAVSLFDALGGTPEPGGTWTAPGGGGHSVMFDPATDVPGVYTYTVTGTSPCLQASATVTVTVNQPADPGTNGSITVCSNAAAFPLFGQLGGTPEGTGAWTGPGGAPVSGTYTPGTSVPGTYTYTVPGTPPCTSASATVVVAQVTASSAGADNSITVCSDDPSFTLTTRLNGSPDLGGTWVGPGGAHGLTFDPATEAGGLFTYSVTGTPPCANVSAALTIVVRDAPDAGTNGTITLCSTDGVFALFDALGGTPDVGGTWRDPANQLHSGNFIPGTSAVGIYTYTVVGLSPCDPASATVTVAVNTAPNAGTGSSVVRCSDAANFSLFNQLGGTPDGGGSWTGPLGAHGNIFDPGVDQPGAYTYTVVGTAPCANATAVVNVSISTAPNAGTNGAITVCANNAPFDLFGELGGTPDATGTWTAPGGGSVGSTFTPGTSVAGDYVYTVVGPVPCANAQATVTVTVIAPPNPGTNGSITVCSSDAAVDLFTLLGGSPATGGTWTRPNGTAHGGTYQPSTDAGGNYTYTVQGTAPCTALSAVVQVVRVIAPNAGTNGSITVCSTNGPFPLINVLGGTPNGSGSWLDSSLAATSGTFTPGTSVPGVYAYVVPGTAPCVNDTGFVTVNVNTAPNAGQNASITVCSNNAPFQLVDELGGTPDGGGTWTRPNGTSHMGTFVPGTSQPGGYTYTVPGLTPCVAASAVVVVSVNEQPDAGSSDSFTRCSTDGPVDLFNQLDNNPDPGGTWTGPDGVSSGVFIPGTSTPGVYTYTLVGTAPCTNATATVTANVNQAPNAGGDGDLTICQGTASVDLFTALTGTFDLNGTWTEMGAPTGQLSGSFFTPGALPPGDYDFRYTVPGIGMCSADLAHVTVTVVPQLDAGTTTNPSTCGNNINVNLFALLGGSPQAGGTWIDLDITGELTGQFFDASSVTPGLYHFRYKLAGTGGCPSDSADVNLNVVAAPNPGTNGSTITCSNASPFDMFPFLGGNPSGGGSWRVGAPNGPPHAATYNPAADNPNSFYYVVAGSPPCTSAHARVVVSEVEASDAGDNESAIVCSDGAQFNMVDSLDGDPDPGGTWYFNNQNHSALFVPGLDVQGIYEYHVPGQSPCNEAVAFLTVSVIPGADAGCNTSITVCSGDAQFLLFNTLTCNPQNGGFWLGPDLQSHNGTYIPLTSTPGDYYYVVPGDAPCGNDTSVVSVFVNDSPNAGTPGAGSYCGSATSPGAAVNLLTLLGGTPDPFGTWVGPAPGNPPFSGLFVPGNSAPGVYTYTVTNSCGSASATVSVSVSAPAHAGCNNSITRCSDDQAFDMVLQLGCSPTFGGQWSGPLPNTTLVSGIFTPGTTVPGTYRYRVLGTGACPNATALLTITVNPEAVAGDNNTLSLCNTDGQVNLFPLLGPTAQTGGSWFFNGVTPHSGIILPSIDVTGTYVYRITGQPGCDNDESQIFVQISPAPNAGNDGLVQVCSTDDPFALISYISGGPQLNGNWTDPVGAPHSGIYDPDIHGPGLYKYRLPGNAGCDPDSAFVTVFEYEAVDAGGDGQIQVCSDGSPFPLFGELTGTPQLGGDWYAPDGSSFTGTYIPGVSAPGIYKYKLIGTSPCANDSAKVEVFENTAPDAGISRLVRICSSHVPITLIDSLGGTPDINGAWTFGGDPFGTDFDPGTDDPGAYLYTVVGAAPCASASAQVVITITEAEDPGLNGSLPACVGADAVALFDGLDGTPTTGGVWSTNCGQGTLTNGIFDASGMASGVSCTFIYTHPEAGPCPATSAQVVLNIVEALDAGSDSSSQACQGQLVDLMASLGGSSQIGGHWVNVDNAGGFIASGWFNTAVVQPGTTWRFDHVLPGSAQCEADTGRVTITVLEGPFAGTDDDDSVCSNSAPVGLATNGGPDPGGSWFNSDWEPHTGTFVPATDPQGVYHYVVDGVGACPADTADVVMTVYQAPDAGNSPINLGICSSDAPVDMFGLLGPNAQTGGNWTFVSGGNTPHSNIYNPAIDLPGVYQYRITAAPPCSDDFAIVTVAEPQLPNAGCNDSITVCSDEGSFSMRTQLDCNAGPGGTWVYVTGGDVPHSNTFVPGVDLPGVYRYTILGTAPCADASALLTVNVITAGNAGVSTTIEACVTQTEVVLFAALGPDAQAGGTWTDLNNSQALTDSTFNPSVAGNGTWQFLYTILGSGPCPMVSSTVTVEVGAGSSAGADSLVSVCGNTTAYDLFTALAGDPTPGGVWQDLSGTGASLVNGVLNVSQIAVGGPYGFGYTVIDPGCGSVSAVVHLTTTTFPVPGVGSSVTLCSTSDPISLVAQLGGTPDDGGVWRNPANQLHGSFFDPGTDAEGNYTYTVAGTEPCVDASAVVNITVNDPPNAGTNGEMLACDTVTALDLFTGLQGTPQTGGTWEDLNASGGLIDGSLNTNLVTPGEYYFRYTVTVPGCASATALVKVAVVTSVEVLDVVRTCIERDRTYTVSFTIEQGDTNTYEVTGLAGSISATSPFIFTSAPLFTSAPFEAFVRDQYGCALVRVEGESPCDFDEEVFVPETFSPNGDGVNELFIIPGIEGYPDNTIVIFNRWGGTMYEAAGYNNGTVVWDGTSPNATLAGPAPTGTYFYVLELGDDVEAITGYVYLNR